ncbi:MAG: carboxylating nicotinate-nucleotide diphosphorylase [Candidatus Alcyoniella australis]|nr:carboxylating nicotinate-nucleotide diphosphorylase [Candidatus Alcyoniella australis]
MSGALKREISRVVRQALREDLGPGDITSHLTLPQRIEGSARIVARQELVVSGINCAARVFEIVPGKVHWEQFVENGQRIQRGTELARLHGPVYALLAGERVALNLLQHFSGIASTTARYVAAVKGTHAKIVDTRKTMPGLRMLQKAAVVHGGGENHRMGLYDAILIKDNHVDACGQLNWAVAIARSRMEQPLPIEVEVRTLKELEMALEAEVEQVLLDNMRPQMIRRAVKIIRRTRPQTLIEASGGVMLRSVREVALAGVDRISVGALTHSSQAVDIAMKYYE